MQRNAISFNAASETLSAYRGISGVVIFIIRGGWYHARHSVSRDLVVRDIIVILMIRRPIALSNQAPLFAHLGRRFSAHERTGVMEEHFRSLALSSHEYLMPTRLRMMRTIRFRMLFYR